MNKIVVLNHKAYMDYNDILIYIKDIKDRLRTDIDIIMCPSSIFIPYFNGKYTFKLGSQNIGFSNITGELTGNQLKSIGVTYALIGHYERVYNNIENSKTINMKIKEAISNNINPIIFVGETKEEYLRKKTGEVIIKQLKEYLHGVSVERNLIVAYEPNISSNSLHTYEEIKEIINMIKTSIFKIYNVNIRVIYGGGLTIKDIEKLSLIKELDGFIIGKSSCNKDKLLDLLDSVK